MTTLFGTSFLSARQKPSAGARLQRPLHGGGFWAPNAGSTNVPSAVPDSAGHNLPATINGTVKLVRGPFGGPALKFDGTSGFVDCRLSGNNAFNWSTTVPFAKTFWAWVRRPTSTSQGAVFSKGTNATNSGWQMSVTNTGLQVGWINATANANYTTGVALSADTWHMVAVAWMGSNLPSLGNGALQIWLNGVPQTITAVASGSGTQNAADTFSLLIGKALYTGGTAGAPTTFADLEIDHWGLDRSYYSTEMIQQLYSRPFRYFLPTSRIALGRGVRRPIVFCAT